MKLKLFAAIISCLTIILPQVMHCNLILSPIGLNLVLIIDPFTNNTNHFHLCPLTAVCQAFLVDCHGFTDIGSNRPLTIT